MVCGGRSTVCVVADQRVCCGTSGGVRYDRSAGVVCQISGFAVAD